MDVSSATSRIEEIVNKLKNFYDKIKEIYNKAARKINTYIDELQKIIDRLIQLGASAIEWIKFQIEKVLKKIIDALDTAQKKIDDIIEQVTKWYNETILNMKIKVIKGVFVKLGTPISDDAAMPLASAIPHPVIESFIPEINIELPLPNLDELLNFDINFELKKLPLL